MLKINEHILKLSGSANLPQGLEEGKSYKIISEVDLTDINEKNNNDGTKNIEYKCRATGIMEVIGEKEKVFAKKTTTPSQKLRFAVEIYHNNHNGEPGYEFLDADPEVFYERFMKQLMGKMENIIRVIFTG